jgi:hypothetical protein
VLGGALDAATCGDDFLRHVLARVKWKRLLFHAFSCVAGEHTLAQIFFFFHLEFVFRGASVLLQQELPPTNTGHAMTDITSANADAPLIRLDPRETKIIQTHANMRKAALQRLSPEEYAAVMAARRHFHEFVKAGGDAARFGLMLFTLEFDNSETPFDGRFDAVDNVPWDEAVQMWAEGMKDVLEIHGDESQ